MKAKKILIAFCLTLISAPVWSGEKDSSSTGTVMPLNKDGSHYVKLSFLNQIWVRYTENNPGTKIYGTPESSVFDIGMRRMRVKLSGQLTDNVHFFFQMGENNFSHISQRYEGFFVHDAFADYKVIEKNLYLGAGLSGWSGLSRYASPSVGSILSLDAPLYQQATNGINDRFLRKLSVFARGKLDKLDYRMALTRPMAVQGGPGFSPSDSLGNQARFSLTSSSLQTQGYLMYQFLDQESNSNPYTVGTYLGEKEIFNLGAGFIYQPEAMWRKNPKGDTAHSPMQLYGIDAFYEAPIGPDQQALTVYLAYNYFDMGKDYLRNVGVMNPANNVSAERGSLNGPGNAFPMIGTGNIVYGQAGYLFPETLLPSDNRLQVYYAVQGADFDRLKAPVIMMEGGVNWLMSKATQNKVSLNYQNRPVFDVTGEELSRRSMVQLQYQVAF